MKLLVRWVQIHDRNVGALRRAGRIAIAVPGLFAIGDKVLDNPSIAVFAGLGAIATLLFVEFEGPGERGSRNSFCLQCRVRHSFASGRSSLAGAGSRPF